MAEVEDNQITKGSEKLPFLLYNGGIEEGV
jgi:hypothetical protein